MTNDDTRAGNPDRFSIDEIAALMPGLARLMPEIGARFWRAFYGARAANWSLAAWQLAEMRKLLRLCEITRPKYTQDIEGWVTDDLEPLMAAVEARDFARFEPQYHEAVDAANELHRRWNKPWIAWKLPDSPPADLDLAAHQ